MGKSAHLLFLIVLTLTFEAYTQTGNVGIGTNTPTEKLEVMGNIRDSTFSTTWKASVAYDSNFVVIYAGRLYKHLTTTNTASPPLDDAVNWDVLSSLITTEEEPLTFTATGTAPTKATTTINDYIYATDDGTWVTINFEYSQLNNAGAANGSGDYLIELPDGYSFDTLIHPLNTQATSLSGNSEFHKIIHLSGLIQGDGFFSYRNYVVPYDATHFRIVTIDTNALSYVSGTSFVMGTHIIVTYKGSFRFKKL